MNPRNALIVLLIALAAAGGYWIGQRPGAAPAAAGREPLYYRNPMGLADTSPVPKKDPMGMDYLPVYAGEATAAHDGSVQISAERIQQLGVRTEAAAFHQMEQTLRAAGRVELAEGRLYTLAPKFDGWVEQLHVNSIGQAVARGQALFEVYSPELVSAQREYALAAAAARLEDTETRQAMQQVAAAALLRLRNWDIPGDQIDALAAGGAARRSLTWRSPVAGVVSEKKAQQGMRFSAGDILYQIADTSSVWLIADLPEQDIGKLSSATGARSQAKVHLAAYPDRIFEGRVSYVYPTLNSETRTVPLRIELANPAGLLKPGMYAQVELSTAAHGPVLAVPRAAVIDSGERRVVLVQREPGRFEPREVQLGGSDQTHVEIRAGLKEGEMVVTAANFLIDAESNLQAALGGMTAATNDTPASAIMPAAPWRPSMPPAATSPSATAPSPACTGRP